MNFLGSAGHVLAILFGLFVGQNVALECIPESFGESSVVCVCNSSYCDTLDHLNTLDGGTFVTYATTKNGLRFLRTAPNSIEWTDDSGNDLKVTVYSGGKHYQKIVGFGGAFTDATGINIGHHDQNLQQLIIDQYFGESGLEYNIGRVPMGGADFSDRAYTYAEVENDTELASFALTSDDFNLKIPYIKEALKRKPDLKLFASVWTAPPWMKNNNAYIGKGKLKPEYYQVWANYFVKFLQEYDKQNLTFWAISTQNEPLHGIVFDMGFNCMGWTADEQRDWIKMHLGPTLDASKFKDIKVIMFDDQRLHLKNYTEEILSDADAAKYISGIGVHWYTDSFVPPDILSTTHYNFPDYFLLATEACAGAMPLQGPDVILGSWERAVNYASDIISDMNNFVAGWIDWNLVLDLSGGPNWAENFVDAPIISDKDLNLIYKQPIYYALGHFSKFIPENSIRIRHSKDNSTAFAGVEILSCLRPDGMVSVILLNRVNTVKKITIINDSGIRNQQGFINMELLPNSISTLVYNPDINVSSTRPADTTYRWSDSLSASTAVQVSNTIFIVLSIYFIS
ncbi:lysosomal acid glucosylceramidase [Folsomia candida]|uniref:lysosomal acid glucosylceramidase n=1 Tax=Folsomia candida TaxID=158441 RepID=UPI000B909EA7|nr:lysosomal acid glucosylceramidase [Folsomia candida]